MMKTIRIGETLYVWSVPGNSWYEKGSRDQYGNVKWLDHFWVSIAIVNGTLEIQK